MSNVIIKKSNDNAIVTLTHWLNDFKTIPKENVNERSMLILEKESSLDLSATLECIKIQSLLNQAIEKKDLLNVTSAAILNTARSFKYSENMTQMQAFVLADDLLDKMKFETLEDILLMLKMGRRGELGSNKGRLDADVLFNLFLPSYNEIKAAQWEELHRLTKVQRQKAEEVIDTEAAAYNYERLSSMAKYLASTSERQKRKHISVDDHNKWLAGLKDVVPRMGSKIIQEELNKAKAAKLLDAVAIYENELNQRNVKVKTP